MPFIGAAIGAIASFVAGAAATIAASSFFASFVTYAITTAISIGLSYLLSAVMQPSKPAAPDPSDIQQNIRQRVKSQRRLHGTTKTGSVLVFAEKRAGITYVWHYICEGPVDFIKFELDDEEVTLKSNGYVSSGPKKNRVRLVAFPGVPGATDETDADFFNAFPELNDPAKPFRHMGCAMVLQMCKQVAREDMADVYPNNLPKLKVVVRRLDVYDPRTDTYGPTNNAALCFLDEAADIYQLDPTSNTDFDLTSWAVFANHCAEEVPLKNGTTEPRYRADGIIERDQEPASRMNELAKACNGYPYLDSEMRIAVKKRVTASQEAEMRHDRGDIEAIDIEGGRTREVEWNMGTASYVRPDSFQSENVIWTEPNSLASDGQTIARNELKLMMVQSVTQAQRLLKLKWHEENPRFAGNLTLGPTGLRLFGRNTTLVDLTPEDETTFLARFDGVQLNPSSMQCTVKYVSIDPSAEDWDPEVDEQSQELQVPDLSQELEDIPLDFTASYTIGEQIGTGFLGSKIYSATAKIFIVGNSGVDVPEYYSQEVQVYTEYTDDEGEQRATFYPVEYDQDTNTATAEVRAYSSFTGADGSRGYLVRARNKTPANSWDWQELGQFTVVLSPTVPDAPVSASVTDQTGLVAGIDFTAPDDGAVRGYRVYRNTSDDFASANLVVTDPASRNQVISTTDTVPAAGVYYYWAVMIDLTGTESTPPTAITGSPVTITD
ncbi:hypothetical protein [Pseudovibrio sp. SPO723]|uniref:hypothetical protein n=1 Tax=Nesiotobacter zosterae TaxID=392721 RepID=UPI0029C4CFFF|nr:hypothetical protein [Pseudovibrio sp. SPO723]MDX5592585.1 hypothetical protein [Pseudovibrio sp. SPO723]